MLECKSVDEAYCFYLEAAVRKESDCFVSHDQGDRESAAIPRKGKVYARRAVRKERDCCRTLGESAVPLTETIDSAT